MIFLIGQQYILRFIIPCNKCNKVLANWIKHGYYLCLNWNNGLNISKVTFGRLDAIQDFCEKKEVTYEEVVYDEMMQCQQVFVL